MKELLKKYSFIWDNSDNMPTDWFEAPFSGNGTTGVQILFSKRGDNTVIHLELGNNTVYDRKPTRDFFMAMQFDNPRLPIGRFEYKVEGEVKDFSMTTFIENGVTKLFIKTIDEEFLGNFFVCAKNDMIVIDQEKGQLSKWQLIPYEAISPRHTYGLEKNQEFRIDRDYVYNEKPVSFQNEDDMWSEQILYDNWKTIVFSKYVYDNKKIFIKIKQDKNLLVDVVKEELLKDIQDNYWEKHEAYWSDYYSISNLNIPDKEIEKFYMRQIYKLGCVVQENSNVIDNQGLWMNCPTPWPGTWWNLNVQLSYWPLLTSNRLDQEKSLINYLIKHKQDLIDNVPDEYKYDSAGFGTTTTWNLKSKIAVPNKDNGKQFLELGNLTWIMHNCYTYYKMSLDEDILTELIYPILRRCVNYYLHFTFEGNDGKIHLPKTSSPEYGELCEDCNYDLSLLKWGAKVLLEIVDILKIEDKKSGVWVDICERLTDYPVNETGYMIGKDVTYAKTHRHFSHLFMHIPLYLVNRENSNTWDLVERSIDHWFSYRGDILAFSFVGASLLCSAYKKGDLAVRHLKDAIFNENVSSTTMYIEDGPVIETPLASAECIQQLLLQSWGDKVRVFPAIPETWEDANFNNFSAQGGFIVSAEYKNHKTKWIEITSIKESKCIIECDIKKGRIIYKSGEPKEFEIYGDLYFELKENEIIRIEAI